MADFSLDLNEDQLQIQKWVHDFAENVDPAGRPRVGRAGGDPLADHRGGGRDRPVLLRLHHPVLLRPDRPAHADRQRGDGLGRRRHRPGHLRAAPWAWPASPPTAPPSSWSSGARSASARPDEDPAGRLRRVRARRRLRRLVAAHPGRLRRGQGRVGPQRHQDLDHQRRHRRHPRGGGLGRPRARVAGPGQLHRAPGHPGAVARARSSRRWASGPRTPPRWCSTTAGCRVTACSGGKDKLDEKLARAREGKRSTSQAAMETFEASRPTVGAQALGHRPGRLRVLPRLRQGAQGVRPGHHREPGHRLQAGRHEDPHRRLPPAGVAGRPGWARNGKEFTAGEGSMSKLYAGRDRGAR